MPRRSASCEFLLIAPIAHSFCGFYVAKADAKLFNKASQVVIVRHDDKTVMTMANDFKGDPKEFAVVIPVPTFISEGQIHIGDKKIIDHLDAYTAPVWSNILTKTLVVAIGWRMKFFRLRLSLLKRLENGGKKKVTG